MSLLDAQAYAAVEVWADLRREFGTQGVYATPYPHFSYQVAASYDLSSVRNAMALAAQRTPPFTAYAGGLGVFPGPKPVVYVPVVRSTAANALHHTLWAEVGKSADGVSESYDDHRWVPHITLACGDVDEEVLPRIVQRLHSRDLSWILKVENVALIEDRGSSQLLTCQISLAGAV